MSATPEISQRDLRLRSREIMDSLERGRSYVVTRGGHQIGELIPLRRNRTFLSREEFLAGGAGPLPVDVDRFRADLDGALDAGLDDPYAR